MSQIIGEECDDSIARIFFDCTVNLACAAGEPSASASAPFPDTSFDPGFNDVRSLVCARNLSRWRARTGLGGSASGGRHRRPIGRWHLGISFVERVQSAAVSRRVAGEDHTHLLGS